MRVPKGDAIENLQAFQNMHNPPRDNTNFSRSGFLRDLRSHLPRLMQYSPVKLDTNSVTGSITQQIQYRLDCFDLPLMLSFREYAQQADITEAKILGCLTS